MVLKDVDLLGSEYFTRYQITDYFIAKKDFAYPVFDLQYESNFKKSSEYLSQFKNLIVTGRNGLFVNNDMHATMVLGIESAQRVIGNTKNKS